MPDRFWVGTGNWTTTNTTNWSTTSGGSGGASVPTSTDDVYFDTNSGNCTVTVTGTNCRNLSFTGLTGLSNYSGTFTLSAASSIHGGLIFSTTMTVSSAGFTFNFIGTGSFTIRTNGKLVPMNITFNNALGNWSFVDALTVNSIRTITVTAGTVTFTNSATLPTLTISGGTVNMNGTATITSSNNVNLSAGTLNINSPNVSLASVPGVGILLSSTGTLNINNDITTNRVTVTGGTAFTIASGKTLSITGGATSGPTSGAITFEIVTSPTTTSFSGSIIKFTNTTANQAGFYGGGRTYDTVWFARGTSTGTNYVSGNNTISTLIDDGTEAHILRFGDSSTQTIITAFNVNGSSSSKRIQLNSITGTGATAFNLNYTGTGVVECQFLDVRNSSVTPYVAPDDYTWYATGSISSGTVTGWSVVDLRYWVGGAGSWSDTTKWALTSGGAGSAGVPNSTRSAIFDSNSGSGAVTITSGATCYELDCSTFGGSFTGSNSLSVYGNVTLGSSFSSYSNQLILRCAGGRTNYLNTNNTTLACQVTILGTGFVILKSNLITTSFLNHDTGTFDTKFGSTSYNVTCLYYISVNTTTLNMNASTFTITGRRPSDGYSWLANNNSLTLNAGTSTIVFTDSTNNTLTFAGGGKIYNLVWFNRGASTGLIEAFAVSPATNGNTYNEFRDTGTAAHSIEWSTLGQTFNIFNVNGASSSARITLNAQVSSNYSFVSTNTGITFCDNIIVNRCTATPAKKFYANTTNSTIGTNTTGWNDSRSSFALLGVG